MKQKFYGVNYTHTYQIYDDNFYIGMSAQTTNKEKADELVMIYSLEQFEELISQYNKMKENQSK